MLDKLKQMNQLRAMQNAMKAERFEFEKDGVKAVVNGNLTVEEIILTQDLPAVTGGQLVRDCINEAIKKAQMAMAKKISDLGFGI